MENDNIVELVKKYLKILNKPENNRCKELFDYTVGKKYFKVIACSDNPRIMNNKVVEAFVEKTTGDVYMPASWNAPAKNVRYNLKKDLGFLEMIINKTSGYLYQDVVNKYKKLNKGDLKWKKNMNVI
tara:strand:- start:298 stop:678 length:381 start_codon:yes stop_codon:yes gene_type:complete